MASNLAAIMAQMGRKVLLVDADLRKPRLHTIFEIERSPGFSNYLAGEHRLEEVILDPEIVNLKVIPAGDIPPNPAELLASPSVRSFMEKVKEQFDILIFDSPPIMGVTDAVELSSYTDGTILVLKSHSTPRTIVDRTIQQLKEVEAKLLGVILNRVNFRKDSYYYYGSYYRYKYYYSYYGHESDGQKKKSRRSSSGKAV